MIMLVFQPMRAFPVGRGDNNRMHFTNVDGGDGKGAPSPYNNCANVGRHRDERRKNT